MAGRAVWYCHDCETHGGGPPNHMSPQEHIDYAHDGYMAEIEYVE